MEDSDLNHLKSIPGFKAILKAVLKCQMKHLVEQLSIHGEEETMILTTNLSDGSFNHLGSSVAKGFLDSRDDIKSQFTGYCMKGVIEKGSLGGNTKLHGARSADWSSDKDGPSAQSETTGSSISSSKQMSRPSIALMRVEDSPASSKTLGLLIASPKGGKKNRKRPGPGVILEKPPKRSTISETVTHALNALATETGEEMDGAVKTENEYVDQDFSKEETDSTDTLDLDLSGTKQDKTIENHVEHQNVEFGDEVLSVVKVEPAEDDDENEFEESIDQVDFSQDQDTADAEDTESRSKTEGSTRGIIPRQSLVSRMMIYQCPVCEYTTRTKWNLEQHKKAHNDDRRHETPFACDQCGAKFTSKYVLNEHIKNLHVSVREALQCPECNYSSMVKSNFKRHLSLHSDEPKQNVPLVCEDCGSQFKSQNGLTLHRKKGHVSPSKKLSSQSRADASICSLCGYTTKHASNFKRHMIKHSPGPKQVSNYFCDQCGAQFKSKYGWQLHKSGIHEKKFKYQCHYCGKGYNTLWNFQGHLRSHDLLSRETCDLCGAKFRFTKSLILHKRKCHTQELGLVGNTYICDVCKRPFSDQNTLYQHKKGMHGGKSFQCNKCSKMFRWRSSLHYHKKTCGQFEGFEGQERDSGTGLEPENSSDQPKYEANDPNMEMADYEYND